MHQSTPAPTERLVYEAPTQVVGISGNAVFVCTTAPSSIAGLEACHRASLELIARYPEGYCQITIAAMSASMPSPEVREKMKVLVRDLRDHLHGMAYVFEGTGMWVSSMRMLTQGMMLAMPSKFPQRIFARTSEGIPWLLRTMGPRAKFDTSALASAILRARGGLRAAS